MRQPGWCSGPSYDPVTVVTRVQIPLRAYFFNEQIINAAGRGILVSDNASDAEREAVAAELEAAICDNRRTTWRPD